MSAKLNPCRPTAATERTASIIHVLLVAASIAMTHGQASAQQSSPSRETACSFRVPDTIPQSSPDAKVTNAPSAYIPLSGPCKFTLFLKQTYSPCTFASAGFQATWAQAMGQWPHYGGGMQGWAKRFGATLADTESRRFIQTFALSTILHQDPRYFPSHKRTPISRSWYAATRVAIARNDNGEGAFNKSEFLGTLFTSA